MARKIKFYFLWLSLVCIIFFILQNMPGIPGFTDSLILNNKAISDFQIWRFVTAIFLHGGLSHLIFNLFALLLFGFILESVIGSKKFSIVFFLSGIIANIIAVNFYNSSLGASGAIYGIIGCITILRPMMMIWAFGLLLPMFVAAGLWIAGDILIIYGFNPGNIGSIAHLSGIVIGFIYGIINKSKFRKIKRQKIKIPENYMKQWEDKYME